jgi:stearoyl-CoA desaturase (delta-9 desaturase)
MRSAVVSSARPQAQKPGRRFVAAPFPLIAAQAVAIAGVLVLGGSWSGFALAVGQKGVLWWASHHRWHHKHSDTERDVRSAKRRGFFFAHMGWLFADTWSSTDPKLVPDLQKFPELRWLDRPGIQHLPAVALALACLLLGGMPGLVSGFFVSTVMVWHGVFAVNSFAHRFGRQRYVTADESRNGWLLAILTCGEGWHNNHHHDSGSARQGFFWWEVDLAYYVLRGLALLGLVHNLRCVPDHLFRFELRRDVRPFQPPSDENTAASLA